ncbi:MAG TPA: BA14K family protein [Bradyrhizobium sp.]|nr:BA14K family protein [Bradyrhizobium sp.]
MTRSGILGATALSLSLSLAFAAPAWAQQSHENSAGGRAAAGIRAGSGNIGGARTGHVNAQANFRGVQSNVAGRGNAQFARGGEFRGDRDRGFGRGFGRDVGVAAGVAAGSALAYGAYDYGSYYDPYYGDSYAYDDGAYDDPGYAVALDQPLPVVPSIVEPVVGDVSYCAQRYRSYDPASGTFLGYDGLRHPCP